MSDPEIPSAESLTVELKSDRKPLPDRELVLAAVCLANSDGGLIYLGVEDDGRPTGLHPDHADFAGLAAMIANRTTPPLSVRVVMIESAGKRVARIEVPRSIRLVATTDGTAATPTPASRWQTAVRSLSAARVRIPRVRPTAVGLLRAAGRRGWPRRP